MSNDPRKILQKYGFQPKKSWGQNFLVDPNTVLRIVNSLGITEDSRVVEMGPGTGVLTQHLAEQASDVFAIERDRDMVHILEHEFAEKSHVRVLSADASTFQLADLPEGSPFLVIGNLPYQLSSPILFSILEQRPLVKKAVFMLQKEVVDRLCASPGDGKDYSVLSIRFGAFFNIRKLFNVSKNCFHPRPKVDSAVFRLEIREQPLVAAEDEETFAAVVAAAFHQRRKTLLNNLSKSKLGLSKAEATELLNELGIDVSRRGEALTIQEFSTLAKAIRERAEQ